MISPCFLGCLQRASLGRALRVPSAPMQFVVFKTLRNKIPRMLEVLHLFRCFTHTHPPAGGWKKLRSGHKKGNENEVKVKLRWKLLNQDAKRGTQKKKEGENTNTWNLAQNGQTLERQGKRKAKADGHGTRPAEGGEGRKRLNQPNTAKTYAYLGTRRTQPTCSGENAWNRGSMGN